MAHAQPIRLLIAALGGEGGGVLASWLHAAAIASGHFVQGTFIPGVAQRTGVDRALSEPLSALIVRCTTRCAFWSPRTPGPIVNGSAAHASILGEAVDPV